MTSIKINKRSITLHSRKTSISLEEPFWQELRDLAERRGMKINHVISEIQAKNVSNNLSSSCRLEVLSDLKERLSKAEAA